MKPVVCVGSLGGTVSMVERNSGDGAKPVLGASSLVQSLAGHHAQADIETETVLSVPSASLTIRDMVEVANWAARKGEAGRSVVLTQGTDTLEETAYLLDLYWTSSKPLVITGAMRVPASLGADGPANLAAAISVAADPASRNRGVLVVMNDEVHSAARVRKVDSTSLNAFSSGVFGVLGRVHESVVAFANEAERFAPLPLPQPANAASETRVALLETYLGDDGRALEAIAKSGFDGVVISAFGGGHVSASTAAVAECVAREIPVLVATRTGSGATLSRTYGFDGSEVDLAKRGVLLTGWLGARKARLLLWALLSAHASESTIREQIRMRGAPSQP